ncbi:MAG: hypothetical protein IM550_04780 [Microcystis sp. M54BS1]|jgi:hypothetical protein|uniref:hypothetical protein n=1 Tax=unclassified Microcystis TaxID=2643300 RepID=UPI001E0871C6|nr:MULTISPECIES: hypothetical protein [unclassified Microcystis]MBE5229441.1 hypothetical protein [Microcystis aeruginosa PMC 728.11]MCA2538571.1 hypothetical protein [Microcystis sp. M54BS1]MCA2595821.1 hypothetical protein [Microcystis sp. M38BS1]MCA2610613.1 hypothetical protein [Microcystis sp. M27BS1]NCS29566.1 hypothetical protein [Microcystis aeruginosa F13-15]
MSIAFFQDIIESVESLSIEEQDYLFDLIYQRRIDKRRQEIAKNGEETLKALAMRTAKKGSAEEIMAYLLENEEE